MVNETLSGWNACMVGGQDMVLLGRIRDFTGRNRMKGVLVGIDVFGAYAWSRTRGGGWVVALRRSLHEYQ